jgi:hypothetical protein
VRTFVPFALLPPPTTRVLFMGGLVVARCFVGEALGLRFGFRVYG